jgi:cobalt-zinc-cadmium efflux system membrane fusion protein
MSLHTVRTCSSRAFVALFLAFLVFTQGCKKKVETASINEQTNPAEVSITPQLAGSLKLGSPEMRDVVGTLEISAHVQTDATRIARVGSPVAGRILKVIVFEGQTVRAGTTLATLHSTSLSDTQVSLIKSYSDQALAEAATKRAEQLLAADVIGRAELERRRAELLQASTEVASFRTQLRGLGMSEAQIRNLESTRRISADYSIVTPNSGTVLERKITAGQVVQPADPAFTVADLSTVWITANVPEEDAGHLKRGMEVVVRIPALLTEKISGQLSYVAPIVDPATRTVEVRMQLANTLGLFKPDQLATMLFTGHKVRELTVPQTAIVREDNKDHIFIETAPNKFLLREVELGEESGDYRVVRSGVSSAEHIVLDGAFHLNNQRMQNSIKGGK